MPMPRLFFALRPEPGQAAAMAEATRPLLQSLGGNAVAVVDLHLTLHFLGEVPEERIDALAIAAANIQPRLLPLALTRIDCWLASRVLCLLPDTSDDTGQQHLATLAAQLRTAAQSCGLTPDTRPFRAHVTVGRKIPSAAARARPWPQACAQSLPFKANGFVLMQGARHPAEMRYAVCHAWPASP
jgi:RNA 2',3'-cyclic 3'-phosphodiesterase